MKTIEWNGVTYTCPFSELMPPLTAEVRTELKADIEMNGILYDVVVTDQNEVIDGHHRLAIAAELELTAVPMKVVTGLTADEKQRRAEDLNLHRRHLTQEQKRAIIDRRLRADPSVSNNTIASSVGADGKTVAAQRKKLESTSEIPKLAATRGKDGKTRKASRSPAEPQKPEPNLADASASPAVEGPAEERREAGPAEAQATALVNGKPRKGFQWRDSLGSFSATVNGLASELQSLSKLKAADRNLAPVLEVANLLRRAANELEKAIRGE